MEGFITHDGMSSSGGDQFYKMDDNNNALTVENCAALCTAVDHCGSFVFRADPEKGSPGASCLFKRELGSLAKTTTARVIYEKIQE